MRKWVVLVIMLLLGVSLLDNTTRSWREKPYTVPAEKSYEIKFTDSNPNYIVIYNYSNNQLYVSRYPDASTEKYDFTVPPLSNRQWGWSGSISTIHIFQGGPDPASINLTSYSAEFDPGAVSQTGQNVLVANDLNIASMPGVTISDGTVNVAGNVTVDGGIIKVVTGDEPFNVGGAVEVTNALTVNNDGQNPMNVAGEVIIGNTASVSVDNVISAIITSGNIDATIGGEVSISSGTVEVINQPGTDISIGGTVTVGNTELNVTNVPGGSLTVAGEVNIGNSPSVNIANTVNANITSGTVDAVIQNATLTSNVTNAMLNTNPLVTFYKSSYENYIISPGGSKYTDVIFLNDSTFKAELGLFNTAWLVLNDESGNINNLEISISSMYLEREMLEHIPVAYPNTIITWPTGLTSTIKRISNPITLPNVPFDKMTLRIKNISSYDVDIGIFFKILTTY